MAAFRKELTIDGFIMLCIEEEIQNVAITVIEVESILWIQPVSMKIH